MIADPYKVLGIRPEATDQELKKAYRELSKKYHPDANPQDPKTAEEKFKEVQEAYRQITDARERGTSAYGSAPHPSSYQREAGYGSASSAGNTYGNGRRTEYREYTDASSAFRDFFSQWQQAQQAAGGSSYGEDYQSAMRAAVNDINAYRYNDALRNLSRVNGSMRNAQWYYVSAIANRGAGNNITAIQHAKHAVDMDPMNGQYAEFLKTLQNGRTNYQSRGEVYSSPIQGSGWCISLCALNFLCSLCGGGGFYI